MAQIESFHFLCYSISEGYSFSEEATWKSACRRAGPQCMRKEAAT